MITDEIVGVVGMDRMACLAIATELRRAGIVTETFLSGNFKKQMARCQNFEAVVMLRDDGTTAIKDMITGYQMTVNGGNIVEQVRYTIDQGIYPAKISYDQALTMA